MGFPQTLNPKCPKPSGLREGLGFRACSSLPNSSARAATAAASMQASAKESNARKGYEDYGEKPHRWRPQPTSKYLESESE